MSRDLRVIIEAKLREMDRKSSNMQVALSRNPEDTIFSLVDALGVFLEQDADRNHLAYWNMQDAMYSRGNKVIQALTQ